MKTLLQLVKTFCESTGLTVPSTITASTDDQVRQIVGLMNEGLDELVAKYKWPQLQDEAVFTSSLLENQGKLTDIAPGYKSMIPNTLWNLSRRQSGTGGQTAQDTQAAKALGIGAGGPPQYRLRGDSLLFIPTQAANQQYRFEYNSEYAVKGADLVRKPYFVLDTDTCLLPDNLIILDLRWRWKAEKGLAYAENMRTFELVCKQAFVDALGAGSVSVLQTQRNARPGIIVPEGNWNA